MVGVLNVDGLTWFTIRRAAEYLDVSPKYIRSLITDEGLSYYRVRHTLFVRREDLDSLIASHKVV